MGANVGIVCAAVLVAVALYRFAPSFYDNVDLIVNRIPCFIFGALLGRLSHERRPLPMPVVAACLTVVAVMLYRCGWLMSLWSRCTFARR